MSEIEPRGTAGPPLHVVFGRRAASAVPSPRNSSGGVAGCAPSGLFASRMREPRETTYQFRATFAVDSSKYERTFDPFDATSHYEAIEHTVQWFRSRGRRRGVKSQPAKGSQSFAGADNPAAATARERQATTARSFIDPSEIAPLSRT